MAIESNDYLVLQQRASGLIHKTTVQNLLDQVQVPASVEKISDLNDVDTTAVTDGQMLVYDTDKWVPQDVPEGVDLGNYLQKPGSDGTWVIVQSGNAITYETLDSQTFDGGEYAT